MRANGGTKADVADRLLLIASGAVLLVATFAISGTDSLRDGRTGRLARQRAISVLGKLGELEGELEVDKTQPDWQIKKLILRGPRVDETQPDSTLVKVALRGSRVTDSTLELLGELPEVSELKLEDTRVTDAGIRQLQCLTELEHLYLDGVEITDAGLAELTSLRKLESLALMDTRIDGTGLNCLKSFDRLRFLAIEGPLATVDGLGRCSGLTELALSATRLTDERLGFLRNLPNIEYLRLFDDTVSFRGLLALRALPRLKQLGTIGVQGSELDLEVFQKANPNVRVNGSHCGGDDFRRSAELEARRLRRQGLTGRLRKACWSLTRPIW
jgi:hypothetical protein